MTRVADPSNALWPGERFIHLFERGVLSVVQLLLMVLIALGVLDLIYLMWHGMTQNLRAIDSVDRLQKAMQRGFAGILLILIGLELLETLRAYLHDHPVRLEVVLIVAVTAIGRHIVMLDLEHRDGLSLLGIAALMLALTCGYFLIRWIASDHRRKGAMSISGFIPEPNPEEPKQ